MKVRTRGPHAAGGMIAGHKSQAKDELMFWSKAVAMATVMMAAPLLPATMPIRGIGGGYPVVLLSYTLTKGSLCNWERKCANLFHVILEDPDPY